MLKFLKNETESATNTSISSFLDLGIFLIEELFIIEEMLIEELKRIEFFFLPT